MEQGRILLIGGDEALRAELDTALTEAGFQVIGVADALEALPRFYEIRPDAVIMARDLMIVDGPGLCCKLRQVSHLPIIVLGGEKEAARTVEMLEVGADACMSNPPDLTELVARVRSLLRCKKGSNLHPPEDGLSSGHKGRTARREDGSGHFTPTEFRLLSCLTLNEGRLLSHAELISEVWSGKPVTKACLKYYVRRLREKLSAALSSPGHILNHRGVGYRFSRAV